MRVAHLLRKYNPAEWGGTETALQRLFDALQPYGVTPIIYCPRHQGNGAADPFAQAGYTMRRFRACVPILGLSREQKQQMIAVGGNLMSFDLPVSLWREPALDLVHSHALGRIGGIGLTLARRRHVPFVVTIHGGVLDLPPALKNNFYRAPSLGWEWGKVFGAIFRARELLGSADAILTCNPREAELLRQKYPNQRIQVQPHGVVTSSFEKDCRPAALSAFPQIKERQVLLAVGRIDAVKNQGWLVERMPGILARHPEALLVLAGSCTDQQYGKMLQQGITELGVNQNVLLTGGLGPSDPRLLGLYQHATVLLLPSVSETFGLVLLEAWAAGKPVISSRTSGATALIKHGQNGWLFDLTDPETFNEGLEQTLSRPELAQAMANNGQKLVKSQYDTQVLARGIKDLYTDLIEEKHALRRSP